MEKWTKFLPINFIGISPNSVLTAKFFPGILQILDFFFFVSFFRFCLNDLSSLLCVQNQVSAPINVQFTMALLAVVVDRALKSVITFRVFSNVGKIQGPSISWSPLLKYPAMRFMAAEKRLYHQDRTMSFRNDLNPLFRIRSQYNL